MRGRRADVAHQRARARRGSASGPVLRLAREQLGDVVVALGHRVVGEAEGGGRGDDDAVAVRDERVVGVVARRLVDVLEAGDRIGAGVRDVDAGGAEADARHRRDSIMKPRASVSPLDGAAQVAAAELERLRRPHVRDRVGPLVGRAVVGALRARRACRTAWRGRTRRRGRRRRGRSCSSPPRGSVLVSSGSTIACVARR